MQQITPTNPCTGKPLQPIDCTVVDDISGKVQNSRSVQQAWAAIPYQEKCELFVKAGETLFERVDDLAELITSEMGKPLSQACGEVQVSPAKIDSIIEDMEKALMPKTHQNGSKLSTVHYVPYGVAALITPWNAPVGIPLKLIVSALLAGNTVLFKPSEIATKTGLALSDILNEVLPNNVLQTIVGSESQAAALTAADIDFLGFVGSQRVGKKIMQAASRRVFRFTLEMGGKDPMIVGKGADLDLAAAFAVQNSLFNSGQLCCSVERIYVEREIEEEFLEKVIEETDNVLVGSEAKGRFSIGPLSSEKQMNHVLTQVNQAVKEGASLVKGGLQIDRAGYYIEPTILTGVSDDMSVMRDETFGPVICIRAIDSVDEAIDISNKSRYGLAATLWMGDTEGAKKKALSIEAGLVGVNGGYGGKNTPWYGTKESGFGFTGGGAAGMRLFLQPRSITVTV